MRILKSIDIDLIRRKSNLFGVLMLWSRNMCTCIKHYAISRDLILLVFLTNLKIHKADFTQLQGPWPLAAPWGFPTCPQLRTPWCPSSLAMLQQDQSPAPHSPVLPWVLWSQAHLQSYGLIQPQPISSPREVPDGGAAPVPLVARGWGWVESRLSGPALPPSYGGPRWSRLPALGSCWSGWPMALGSLCYGFMCSGVTCLHSLITFTDGLNLVGFTFNDQSYFELNLTEKIFNFCLLALD